MPDSSAAVARAAAARAALDEGRPVVACAEARAAAEALRRGPGDRSPDLANVLVTWAQAESQLGRPDGAQRLARDAVALLSTAPRGEHRDLDRLRAQAANTLGSILTDRGEYAAARRALEAALADAARWIHDAPELGALHNSLGVLAKHAGRLDAAQVHYSAALRCIERCAPRDAAQRAALEHNLGGLAFSRGDDAAAERHTRRALHLRRSAHGDDHPHVAADRGQLGSVLARQGRLAEAERELRAARETFAARYGADHVEVGIAQTGLAAVLHRAGRLAEAEREYRAGLAVRMRRVGARHPELATAMTNLGTVLAAQGRDAEAADAYRRALAMLSRIPGDHPVRAACLALLAELA